MFYTSECTLRRGLPGHQATKSSSRYIQRLSSVALIELNRYATQGGLTEGLSHLRHLMSLRIDLPSNVVYPWGQAGGEDGVIISAEIAKLRKTEVARVRALRAFPPLALHALPALRVLAVGDDQPKFRSENERLGVDEPGIDQYEESADVLDEMRQLSVEGRPGRNMRWW